MANKLKVSVVLVATIAILFAFDLITSPIIEKNNASSRFEPLFEVMSDAKDFEVLYELDDKDNSSLKDVSDTVVGVYKETSGLGYVVLLSTTQGYTHEPITFTIAFDPQGVITNIALTNYPETKDFGKDYPSTYIGQDSTLADVNIVAGVTFSSTAFKNATSDAFNVLIANDLVEAGKMGDDQILKESLLTAFSSMATAQGAAQYEESDITSGTLYKSFKALNDGGYAFLAKDNGTTVLALVNNDGLVKVLDVEGNDVTSQHEQVVNDSKDYAADKLVEISSKDIKTLTKLASDQQLNDLAMNGIYNSVVKAYSIGDSYGFIVKTYGFSNTVMTSYFIIDADGNISKMTVDEIIIEKEYFNNYDLPDENAYKDGFIGYNSSTYNSDVALISGATMSTNAIDMAAKSALEAYSIIKGE